MATKQEDQNPRDSQNLQGGLCDDQNTSKSSTPLDLVQQYLSETELGPGVVEGHRAAKMCAECLSLFQAILQELRANKPPLSTEKKTAVVSLQRSYSRLKMWSDEHGVSAGGIDEVLMRSWFLERIILKHLTSIGSTLADRVFDFVDIPLGVTGQQSMKRLRDLTADGDAIELHSDGSSDSGDSSYSSDSLGEALGDLQTDTTCLLDLEPLLNSPIALVDMELSRPDRLEVWNPSEAYSDKISTRFPGAVTAVISKLGQANYERYLRCQEERNQNQSESQWHDASTGTHTDAASSKFHDSGIGSSLATTYAETVMSYGGDEGRKVRVPPLSAAAQAGAPFECICCAKLVTFRTNSAWKTHLYADLRPWVCLDLMCQTSGETFPTRKDWVSHLALDHCLAPHWAAITCPLCQFDTGSGKVALTKHLTSHLEEVSLAALPVECDFDEESVVSELEVQNTDDTEKDHSKEATANTDEAFGESIQCVCNVSSDDGDMINCMECGTRQHISCYYPEENADKYSQVLHRCTRCTVSETLRLAAIGPLPEFWGTPNDHGAIPNDLGSRENRDTFEAQTEPSHVVTSRQEGVPNAPGAEVGVHPLLNDRGIRPIPNSRHMEGAAQAYAPSRTTSVDILEQNTTNSLGAVDVPNFGFPTGSGLRDSDGGSQGPEGWVRETAPEKTREVCDPDDPDDPDEPRYCYCNRVSSGEMIGCDGGSCKREWFHLECVGLRKAPPSNTKWFCEDCEAPKSAQLREQAEESVKTAAALVRRR